MTVVAAKSRPADHARQEVLVDTAWVSERLGDARMRVVEVNEDVRLYERGHIAGAIKLDWQTELRHPLRRDVIVREDFEALMARKGVGERATVVLYGDRGNRLAAYAFWLFALYGHADCRIMDGGRTAWEREGRPWSHDSIVLRPASYAARPADLSIRAFRDEVYRRIEAGGVLVDVRSSAEYRGELTHDPSHLEQGAQRGGHIPGAVNLPWETVVAEDGTFKGPAELGAIYDLADEPIITYAAIGEHACHSWFVLRYLLGYRQVKVYDGSWTEWGSLVAAPIAR